MMLCNEDVKGIKIGDAENCFSQYAYDTVLFLSSSESSMGSAFKNLGLFASISGLRVNTDKTNAIWIGSKKNSVDKLCKEINVNWVDVKGAFKVLGVELSTYLNSMVLLNYKKVYILSLLNQIAMWSKRNLTVLRRVTVVKSLLLSKLTFLILSLLNPPNNVIKDLNPMFFNFIWKGNDRISRNQMIQDYSQGSLRMVDVGL